jgi:acetate kinase
MVKEDRKMKILVLNCGSSSIKYKLFENRELLTSGLIARIGEKGSKIKSYKQGLKLMLEQLAESKKIKNISEIKAIGHRVVHGGMLSNSCIIDKKIIRVIKKFSPLAPLHNPANLKGILEMQEILPKIPNIAVFDTAFHNTLPEYAYIYALPYEFYKKHKIRRYGFHGISYQYVSQRISKFLKKPIDKLNLIICHLGAGCSMVAVKNKRVIDTSMGFTPLEGLVMGTRCGDVDAGILIYLSKKFKIEPDHLDSLLNKKSGLAGISGVGSDIRLILNGYQKGNKRCKLALEIFSYRIKKYIAAYAAALGKVDAVAFTAGIGENVPLIRSWSADIDSLGIKIDENKNKKAIGEEAIISSDNSKIKVLVIPTNEAKMIAIETEKLLK